MVTYVALIRGINVGGHQQIKMEELREAFRGRGFPGRRRDRRPQRGAVGPTVRDSLVLAQHHLLHAGDLGIPGVVGARHRSRCADHLRAGGVRGPRGRL